MWLKPPPYIPFQCSSVIPHYRKDIEWDYADTRKCSSWPSRTPHWNKYLQLLVHLSTFTYEVFPSSKGKRCNRWNYTTTAALGCHMLLSFYLVFSAGKARSHWGKMHKGISEKASKQYFKFDDKSSEESSSYPCTRLRYSHINCIFYLHGTHYASYILSYCGSYNPGSLPWSGELLL